MYHLPRVSKQLFLLVFFIVGAMFTICARLIFLQITNGSFYLMRGKKNFLRTEVIPPIRGTIFDCHNKILATNRPIHHLIWHGTGNRTITENQINLLSSLESILGCSIIDNKPLLSSIQRVEKQYRHLIIAHNISLEQLSKIKEKFPEVLNLSIHTEFQRYYPYGSCASHLIGYLHKSVNASSGKMGLEKLCNTVLYGQEGTLLKTINSVGRSIETVELTQACAGNDIHTTIDIALQNIVEHIFPPEKSGCILIMDPFDGAIKALISHPTFDPSLFLRPIHTHEWKTLQEKKPFLNRALSAYPPGSIFKLVTISAALENGYLSPNQCWSCKGYVKFAGRKYWCNQRPGHGVLNTMQTIAQSCNALFFEIGKIIDIDLLNHYAGKFGLGMPTGIILPEKTGLIPSRAWKLREKGEKWWPGETLSVAIGQSFLMATPLQVARMVSSIFTGYLTNPRILQEEASIKTPLSLLPSTINFLKESMRFVVTQGTGQRLNVIKDIEIYAKTSTAQITDFQKRMLSDQNLEHAWFVAYFQYKEHKPLVFVILVENAGTSKIPATIAKQFILKYRNIASEIEKTTANISVP